MLTNRVVQRESVELTPPRNSANGRARVRVWHFWAAVLVIEVILFAWFGVVNRDEGWYLYASRLVYDGRIPYRDFTYFQAPVLPYLYGLPQVLFGPSLLVGRVTSVVFLLIASVAVAASAEVVAGPKARTWALALICANPVLLAFGTLARSEAATTALCALAAFCLLRYREGLPALLAAPALLLLAAGIRSPIAIAFMLVAGYAWWRSQTSWGERTIAACALAGELVLISLPVLLSAHRVAFELWSSQVHRSVQFSAPGAASPSIQSRIETIYFSYIEFVVLITPMIAIVAYLGIRYRHGWRPLWREPADDAPTVYLLLTVLGLAVFAPFITAVPFEPRYFVPASALLTMVVAAAASARPPERDAPTRFGLLIAGVTAAVAVCAAPLYIVVGQTQMVPRTPNAQLRSADQIIAADMGPGDTLLAFDPTLAVAAGVKLMPRLEMGQFSYWPTMSDADASAHGVYNKQGLMKAIGTGTPKVVALTDFDLGSFIGHTVAPPPGNIKAQLGQFPALLIPSLVLHYRVQEVLGEYGQYGDHLYILVRR